MARVAILRNVSSVQALATQENVCAYTVSKHGLVGLTRSLVVDFGGRGLRADRSSTTGLSQLSRTGWTRAVYGISMCRLAWSRRHPSNALCQDMCLAWT